MKKIFMMLSMAIAMTCLMQACTGATGDKRAELPEDIAMEVTKASLAGDFKTMLSYDIDFNMADEAEKEETMKNFSEVDIDAWVKQNEGITFKVQNPQENPEEFYGKFEDGTYDDLVTLEITMPDGTTKEVPCTFVKKDGKWYAQMGS